MCGWLQEWRDCPTGEDKVRMLLFVMDPHCKLFKVSHVTRARRSRAGRSHDA